MFAPIIMSDSVNSLWSACTAAALHQLSRNLMRFRADFCPVRQHRFGCGPAALRNEHRITVRVLLHQTVANHLVSRGRQFRFHR